MDSNATIATIIVQQHVPVKRVWDVLSNWFDNGSIDSWAQLQEVNYGVGNTKADFSPGGKFYPDDDEGFEVYRKAIVPTVPGGSLVIGEDEEDDGKFSKQHTLNLEKIQMGLQVMHDKYGHHYGDFISENDDIVTASVFVQCCLFGEYVYG